MPTAATRLRPETYTKPLREVGSFFALSLQTLARIVQPPFAWREFVNQAWFMARVSAPPAVLLTIPFNALSILTLNILLAAIGAGDFSGGASALACVVYIGPITTVVTLGAVSATAVCADLGARTIREEIDAMRVMGIDPVQRLVVPRVVGLGLNGILINAIDTCFGLASCYFFSTTFQHVNPGSFAAGLPLLVGLTDVVVAFLKSLLFGLIAGLIGCYKGLTVGGGPQGVGTAVNETVVYTLVALFVINIALIALTVKATT
ncbi:MlaE family ABC transporter permease [Mycobacterium xenopi]|uniref:MlaE family ABC transporter permease n=1 Tax=Mycobacterium xenopi TaxID=1789 RepID=UPI0022EB6396|nr:ABC transporter permease [Mycobacterium xenopi]MDA3657819.1 ABC transporter permease [Mycobacterium xenopi]